MYGVTIGNMKEIGRPIRCMERGQQSGLMGENIKGNMSVIRKMVWEHLIGRMEGNFMEFGRMVSSMDEDSTILLLARKR